MVSDFFDRAELIPLQATKEVQKIRTLTTINFFKLLSFP